MRVSDSARNQRIGDRNEETSDAFLRILDRTRGDSSAGRPHDSVPSGFGPLEPPNKSFDTGSQDDSDRIIPPSKPFDKDLLDDLRSGPNDSTYTVGSFNTYSVHNIDGERNSGVEYATEYASELDIVGFQETGGDDAAKLTGSLVDEGMNGYVPDNNSNPIYWKADKFDLVHSESIVFHEPNERGPGVSEDEPTSDQTRTTTIVVLRDKETGNLMLVTNLHADHNNGDTDRSASRDAQLDQLAERQEELMEQFPEIQATVNLGDLNQKSARSLDDDADIHNNPSDSSLDHIIVSGENGGDITDPEEDNLDSPDNTDFYDHRPLRQTFTLEGNLSESDKEASREYEIVDNNGRGAVFYQNDRYNEHDNGKAWVIGFGNEESQQPKWNDRVSSVKLSDDVEIELFDDVGHDDDGDLELSGESLELEDSSGNLGKDMNDETSGYRIRYS